MTVNFVLNNNESLYYSTQPRNTSAKLAILSILCETTPRCCKEVLRVLPPLLLGVHALEALPHVRHAQVRVQPVDLARLEVAEAQAEAGDTLHLMDVQNLLDDPLRNNQHQETSSIMTTL